MDSAKYQQDVRATEKSCGVGREKDQDIAAIENIRVALSPLGPSRRIAVLKFLLETEGDLYGDQFAAQVGMAARAKTLR